MTEYLPGARHVDMICTCSLLATAFLLCDGKVMDKAATLEDIIAWHNIKYNPQDCEEYYIQRNDSELHEIIRKMIEFAVIDYRFFKNGIKTTGAVYENEKTDAKYHIDALILSEQ